MLSRGGSSSSSVWMNSHGELVSHRSSSFGIPPPPPPPSAGSRLPPPPPPPRATAGLQSPSSAELLLAPPDAQPPPLPAVFSAQRSSRVPSGMLSCIVEQVHTGHPRRAQSHLVCFCGSCGGRREREQWSERRLRCNFLSFGKLHRRRLTTGQFYKGLIATGQFVEGIIIRVGLT